MDLSRREYLTLVGGAAAALAGSRPARVLAGRVGQSQPS